MGINVPKFALLMLMHFHTHRMQGVSVKVCLPFLQPNSDISSSRAFALGHTRPGTLSLSLTESDEDPGVRSRPGYSSLEFLITTGAFYQPLE